ncbi:MAG TPA: hypothetical protein VF135_11530, partial [Terriglobales bacterium]
MKRTFLLLLLGFIAAINLYSQDKEKTTAPPKDTAELQQRIETILKENKVPGAGVVITNRNGIVWVAGIGKSDVAANKDATPE